VAGAANEMQNLVAGGLVVAARVWIVNEDNFHVFTGRLSD
jgi:hypothetical protein